MRRCGLAISIAAEDALRRFCGDPGFRPEDEPGSAERPSDPSRWYWEELPAAGKADLEAFFDVYQSDITRILLREAYADDPYPPDYVLHQRFRSDSVDECPLAIYAIDELVAWSCAHGGFSTKEYVIRKGKYAGDKAKHLAPRFGIVQFQRGGQRQHPTQLQFNLRAGHFNDIV
jgi:hypothetical protein